MMVMTNDFGETVPWSYETDIPHKSVELTADEELYCKAVIFFCKRLESNRGMKMKQTELGLIPDDWEVKESNAVARVGSDKTGHWEIVNREKCEKQSQNIRKNVIFNSKNAGKM